MKQNLIAVASIAALLAAVLPCKAQEDSSRTRRSLESFFQSPGSKEAAFHARSIPIHGELGGADDSRDLAGFIPGCGAQGAFKLPSRYAAEYAISPQDKGKLQSILNVLKKYSSAKRALADGYAPVDLYEDGVGVAFARADLFTDRRYDLAEPDLLFYVKERDRAALRIVGAAYVAGESVPRKEFMITRRDSKDLMRLWRPWEKICFKSRDGVFSYYDSEDGQKDCAGGTYIRKTWVMHVWLPLYNPKGLFTPRNPLVNYLDLTGQAFPFCSNKK
ncbi:MAG: hypothetical protein WCU88_03895 [Elusimicrobiota bacterium]|jgi:hypothetical protein